MRVLIVTAAVALLPMAPLPVADAAAHKQAAPTVQPDPATPGARIWVSDAGRCTSPAGTATSPALTAPITLARQATRLSGPGTLREDLISGTYTLTLHCGDTLTADFRIEATARSADAAVPRGAPDAGGGSAADHLGIGDAALGSAFVLGGIAFGTASIVRRRRGGGARG